MTYKGKFKPKYPTKYQGDIKEIVYRSSWELKMMKYCDTTKSVVEWGSEELVIPYVSPWDGRYHRYFPDFYVKYKRKDGIIMEELVEVKPKKQVDGPPTNPKRRTQAWLREVQTYVTNRAKWEAAAEYCEDRGWSFRLVTEKNLAL